MPVGGRFSSRTLSPSCSTSIQVLRVGTVFFGRDAGNSFCRPVTFATQSAANGQRAQSGLPRTHSVAPRSIKPCVYAVTSSLCAASGSSDSASVHIVFSTRFSPGNPSMPNTRASTRFTLPSRMVARAPNANDAIAAAVERPMPGSSASSSTLRGNSPPCSVDHHKRASMQISRARVVAEAGPERHDVVERRGGERVHVGKRSRKRA